MKDIKRYAPETKIPYDMDLDPEKDTFEHYRKHKDQGRYLYHSDAECVSEPVESNDTSDKIRRLVDKLDCIGNTLSDTNAFLDCDHPVPPEFSTPGCLLHALEIMELQTNFILNIAEDIRMKVR